MRALVHGRDLQVRLYFRAIYHLGGMVLAFASLFHDFVVDCIFYSSSIYEQFLEGRWRWVYDDAFMLL